MYNRRFPFWRYREKGDGQVGRGQVLGDAVLEAKWTIPCGRCGENEALANVMSRICLTERLPVSTTFHSHLVPAAGNSPLKRQVKPTLESKGTSCAMR